MYTIGLTGNIATGKSTVAAMLAHLGADVIDADRVAHELMRRGTAAHKRIVQRFGERVLATDGEIDRKALGERVFANPNELAALERILHPAVIDEIRERLAQRRPEIAVIEAIKLLEAHMHEDCDAVWVVTAPRRLQLARMVQERHMTPSEAALRIDAQPPAHTKTALADVIIDNSVDLRIMWLQVLRAWRAISVARSIVCDSPCPLTRKAADT